MTNAIESSNAGGGEEIARVVLAVHRFGVRALRYRGPGRTLLWKAYRTVDLVVVKIAAGAEVPATASIGLGVTLAHGARGLVVSGSARVGSRVTLYHQVTLARDVVVDDDVWIGTGAKVLEGVHIHRGAKVGANAVVTRDVPAGYTAVGVPARVLPSRAGDRGLELLVSEV